MELKKLKPCIAAGSLASPLEVGADRADAVAKQLAAVIESLGAQTVSLGAINDPIKSRLAGRQMAQAGVDGVVLAAVSWFEDYLVLDLLEEFTVPVLLMALPGMETGALCGTQQLTFYLKQLGYAYHGLYGELSSEAIRESLTSWMAAAYLRKRLRQSRVGATGHRVYGMTESSPNEVALKKSLGPRIVYVELAKILETARNLPDQPAEAIWQQVVARSSKCLVAQQAGLTAVKVYQTLKQTVQDNHLDALAFGCYPDWMGYACLASSLLADEGVPVGCEGDVNALVGQMMLMWLSGQPTHNADWLEPLADGTVVFTHCGSGSFSLAQDPSRIELAPVRLLYQGVCALFPAKTGQVTLLNIVPLGDIYQVAMLTGLALPCDMVFPGNPVRVQFKQPTKDIIDWIYQEGIGHHWIIGYGDFVAELTFWANMVGRPVRFIQP